MKTKCNRRIIYPTLSILFPCIIGITGMLSENVSIIIWGQNILLIFLLSFISFFVLKHKLKFNYKLIIVVSAFLLGLTFLGPNMEGVHRWLRLPFFTLNISTIVMPITIVAFYKLIEENKFLISTIGIIVIEFLLCLQPDASQLSAFSLAIIILLLKSNISKIVKSIFSVTLFLLTLKSWIWLDTLQPVNYTEGILTMVLDLSVVLYIIGIAALFFIPVYFLIFCQKKSRNICVGITIYYWVMILATFIGNFPVPFMGYGISPILGFYIFLIWFI
ncbi:cell division protein [Blautia schinkii]|nr:cell division protein [Blautia schinkii]